MSMSNFISITINIMDMNAHVNLAFHIHIGGQMSDIKGIT
jgi:hypothetical protein